jgi:predicted lipid-binding transport protein (Tim44 family)
MSYLLVGAMIVGLIVWAGGPGRMLKYAQWRITSGVAAIGVFAAAGFIGVRGGWGKALLLAVIGLALAVSARWPRAQRPRAVAFETMSAGEARALLGVSAHADGAEIQTAYARLMKLAHPDRGGTDGLAAQLNRARDRLLKG